MSNEKRYALVRAGLVENVLIWDGVSGEKWTGKGPKPADWQPWSKGFGDDVSLIPLGDDSIVGPGWSHAGTTFTAPPAPDAEPETADQVLAQRDRLLAAAAVRIAPLQDAVDLSDATAAETTALKAWKQYRVKLSRIEQQTGFPAKIKWPAAPQ